MIMKKTFWVILVALSLMSAGLPVLSQNSRKKLEIIVPKVYSPLKTEESPELRAILSEAVDKAVSAYNFKPEQMSATLIDLSDSAHIRIASVRGNSQIYPASVVKMFYMAALERQMEDGKITTSPELERGLKDMIVVSSNEATQYILDVLTDTSSGAELPQKQFDQWQFQRNRVNRFFTSMGYSNINVNQKTFCEDAYGIEQQSRGYKGKNRNMLTTDATARLLAEIVTGRMNTPARTSEMMALMSRDWTSSSDDPDSQAVAFSGKALADGKMTGTKLWSKAGWTNKARHDAAYIELPDGSKFVIVVFTEDHANEKEPIPAVVGAVIEKLKRH